MILKKLGLTIFLTLSISACQTKVDIVKACGLGNQYAPVNLGLNSDSEIEDYQSGLVIRKHELKMNNRRSEQEADCVKEIQRYMK